MIRREHIKQAIDAISRRNPEIGYSLDELFDAGMIDAEPELKGASEDQNFYFLFEGKRVRVNRVLFFQEGTAPIEQGLLIRYGELVRRQEIQERGETPDYPAALREIHQAGLRLAVEYELDLALSRLKKNVSQHEALIGQIERIRQEEAVLSIGQSPSDPAYLYMGALDGDSPAFFTCFPYCMGRLMEVAALNLEFFSVRFVLGCLLRGVERNLLACVLGNRIVGLVFLTLREHLFRRDLEIRYIATRRTGSQDLDGVPLGKARGAGTFLVAGVWMLAKNEMDGSMDIVLDAEVGARGFYESVGFESRGFSGFVLRRPKPTLLRALLAIARNHPDLRPRTIREIASMIKRHVKRLRKKPVTEKEISERKIVIECVQECLMPDSRPEFMDAALQPLLRYRARIVEAEDLIRAVSEKVPNRVRIHGHAAGTHR